MSWSHNLVNNQLQYIYFPISHELKVTWQGIFFFKNHAENEAGRLVLDLFLFFKKALYEVKACGLQLRFTKSDIPPRGTK